MVLFAILASAPQPAYKDLEHHHSPPRCSDDYFISAMMARRIAEDDYLRTPSTSSMMVSAAGHRHCLGITPADRGRVEHAIRGSEAIGIQIGSSGK